MKIVGVRSDVVQQKLVWLIDSPGLLVSVGIVWKLFYLAESFSRAKKAHFKSFSSS
jgi:hypothetical protein